MDIVQNIGPLGFISYPGAYTGFLGYGKLALICLLAVVLAGLSIRTAWLLRGNTAKIFFLLFVWMFTEPDVQNYLLTLLIGYTLYFSASLAISLALIPVLVILSLAKSTLLFIAIAIIGITTLYHILGRRWLFATLLPSSFAVFFVIIWWLSGQPVANILSFMQAAAHFSTGYSEAMAYFESSSMSWLGFLSLIIAGAAIVYHRLYFKRKHASAVDKASDWGLALMEGVILFAVWKHGFVRADGHVAKFFAFLAIAAPLYVWLPSQQGEIISRKEMFFRTGLLLVIIGLCIGGYERNYRFKGAGEIFISGIEWDKMNISKAEWKRMGACATIWGRMKIAATGWDRMEIFGRERSAMANNIYTVWDIKDHFAILYSELAAAIKVFDLPQVNALVGNQEVSYFGSRPGVMVYNRFRYRPMPATISFAAWNPWIMEKDAAFLRNDDTAPHYVLYHLDAMDNMLTAQYDSLAQLELLQHYDITLEEKDNLLLTRRSNVPEPVLGSAIMEKTYSLKAWAELPPMDGPAWIRIDVPDTPIGKLLAAAYKPPEYSIEYTLANGQTHTNRLIRGTARVGFMAAPFISNNSEFAAANAADEYSRYQTGKSSRLSRITRFRLHCVHERISCAKTFTVSLDNIQGLQLGRMAGGK